MTWLTGAGLGLGLGLGLGEAAGGAGGDGVVPPGAAGVDEGRGLDIGDEDPASDVDSDAARARARDGQRFVAELREARVGSAGNLGGV